MAKRASSGLRKRGDVWHIQKQVGGYGTLHESTGTGDLDEAERFLARLEAIRRTVVYGERPVITFREAAEQYMNEHAHLKPSRGSGTFDAVLPFIGDLPLERVHDGVLATFKADRLKRLHCGHHQPGSVVRRRVLNLAARLWRHPNGMTYLETAPLISMAKGAKRSRIP